MREEHVVIVGKRRKRRAVTAETLRALLGNAPPPLDPRIERRLAQLEQRAEDADRRADTLARRIIAIERRPPP